jgi:diguanylate cyclase (GGDEF)-like protein
VILVFSNVTESRRLSQELAYQATHDVLTKLPNRAEFERRLQRVLETSRTFSTENALCFLDLDRFKLVNDTSGHFAGDELLRQISELLKAHVRKRDTLARLGGDEFGLLMEHCCINEAMEVARKLTKVVADFRFFWEDKPFNIGVSIGLIAVNESAKSIDDLLNSADAACYMAKEQGRDRVHLYEVDDEELIKRHGEMQWAARLPQAIKDERLCLYYQPIATAAVISGEQAHYELLIRMKDETGNIIPPGAFLPAAERYNLSGRIDRWVIDTAFRQLIHHPEQLENLFLCAINLSGHSLSDEKFLLFIRQKLEEFPIPANKICFEITETAAIANLKRATALINELKGHGCHFALDDFGSGLSSFAYLKNLPIDFLKIDGSFVRDILHDPIDFAMVKSINEIGQAMGIQTIAEFVESEAVLKKLQAVGVDYAQGYLIGQPQPFSEWLQTSGPRNRDRSCNQSFLIARPEHPT